MPGSSYLFVSAGRLLQTAPCLCRRPRPWWREAWGSEMRWGTCCHAWTCR